MTFISGITHIFSFSGLNIFTFEAFYSGLISRFGVPDVIVSDKGSQFEKHLFQVLDKYPGTENRCTTGYNPASNVMVENFNASLNMLLNAMLLNIGLKFYQFLFLVLLLA
ncbi:hypothetical protein NPIL_430281 [Nephila pilipes]|uniref:Integrase catalytic domain-containing protein n=1 Tax=Nephila pilipes TaxID=299642 RepID=A0A8X6MKE5_NEPPI|nr:hypothetical protein NPIL_430281 [Nephila pilipes]